MAIGVDQLISGGSTPINRNREANGVVAEVQGFDETGGCRRLLSLERLLGLQGSTGCRPGLL